MEIGSGSAAIRQAMDLALMQKTMVQNVQANSQLIESMDAVMTQLENIDLTSGSSVDYTV